ncbi:hypothetical protein Tco_1576965 [Tanacetum coccineum]
MIHPEPKGSTQGYPLDSVEVLRFYTSAGNPVKDILLKLNLPDHRSILTDLKILKDGGEVISKDIVNIIVNSSVDNAYVNVNECEKCLKLETELLNKKDFIEMETYDKLDNSVSNQSAPSFDQYFKLNELKARLQEKDTVIKKLKNRIKSLSGNINEDKDKKNIEEIETMNIELDHRMSKLIAKNEHLKQTYKQLYDSIKPTCDALIAQINAKSVENSDLNAQLQEKVFAITTLKEELRKLKGKSVIACRESVNKPKVITPVVHKVDLEPLTPKLKNNREAHDLLFQPLFDELFNPPSSVDRPAPEVIAPIAEVVAPVPAASTGSPSSTTVDQDAPSPSNFQITPKTQSPIISNDVKEDNHDLDAAHMNNDPFFGIPIPENDSEASSSSDVIPTVVHTAAPNSKHITK